MKAAIISVTTQGAELSKRIADALSTQDATRYCFEKYPSEGAETFGNLSQITAEIFAEYDALIFVCACGIAVRAIAPHIRSKQTDPAVVVLDDCGNFAISLLSGHLGGANRLTEKLSEALGAQPVITTATDTGRKFSPDSFAAANDLCFNDYNAAKEIAAAVLRGEKIMLYSDIECVNIPNGIQIGKTGKFGIRICREMSEKPFGVTLSMVPKNIVLGVGCKKNTEYPALVSLLKHTLSVTQISRIREVATIDRKSQEPCIHQLCEDLKVPLKTYSAEQLASVSGTFSMSEFVEQTVGVSNVCERSAAIGGNTLIIRKTAANGVTVAAAERNVLIDFSRKQL